MSLRERKMRDTMRVMPDGSRVVSRSIPLTSVEQKRVQEREATRKSIAEERFWNKRPDGPIV
jgi:hypothetical protein